MRKVLLIVLFLVLGSRFTVLPAHAQSSPLPEQPVANEQFVKAQVLEIVKETKTQSDGFATLNQTIKLQILEGSQQGKTITVERGTDLRLAKEQKISPGTTVVLDITTPPNGPPVYTITDIYRLNYLLYLIIGFFLLIIFIAGKKGVGSIVGMCVSIFVILAFIVPQILNGQDPLFISIIGCFIILIATTYLAHGFSKQTTIAVFSTFLALTATVFFALLAVRLAHLAGLGTEDSYLLEINPTHSINPKGLLLGGILIGTLGALNDITTTQVAAIFALKKSSPAMHWLTLAEHGFLIGREHIVSLVNTLVLAYAGSSITIFIFFVLNPSHLPWWVIVNNESVSEEIVRTIAGSFGLILAVPITILLATWYLHKRNFK